MPCPYKSGPWYNKVGALVLDGQIQVELLLLKVSQDFLSEVFPRLSGRSKKYSTI